MNSQSEIDDPVLQRARQGDAQALTELFERHRARLRCVVQLRMDRKLLGRVDASDIIQDAYLEAAKRLNQYLDETPLPFYLWLRHITGQKLADAHRRHLGAQARDAYRECSLFFGAMPGATSASLAEHLLGRLTTPSQAAVRAEMTKRVQETLESMEEIDREVLVLRHFEQMTNAEVSQVLDLSESAASKRYIRALERFDKLLGDLPD